MRDPMKGLEQVITDAQQEGKFDDLPGKGKPLVIDPSPDAVVRGILKEANVSFAPEWITLACEIDRLQEQEEELLRRFAEESARELKALAEPPAAAALPERAERGQSWWHGAFGRLTAKLSTGQPRLARAEPSISHAQRRWDETVERYAALLHEANRKIRRFNQIVPLADRQRARLLVPERLEQFAERFPRPARTADGTVRLERGAVPVSLLTPPPPPEGWGTRKRDLLETAALLKTHQRKPPPIG